MKYGECNKEIKKIIANAIENSEIGINFDDDIEEGVFYHALASDITWFIYSNFGLESDFKQPKEVK
ncbi:MAG TPA: hypothetical protein GX530_06965 [Corynebacteriales bacterium]|jgi:hypothetical protein|nr:hypothetical protein [Mycobacteriales bacterium]